MSGYEKFYEESLYPLQNGILRTLAPVCGNVLSLTGGTALSRIYFHHRYSDDLDLFGNSVEHFNEIVEASLSALENAGYQFVKGSIIRHEAYTQAVVRNGGTNLKLDFVNDVAAHFGECIAHPLYPRIDSVRNILSNKLTALYRLEPKDIADLYFIACSYQFDWAVALQEAESKEAGLDAITIADIISTFPRDMFKAIKWRITPNPDDFFKNLTIMTRDILHASPNSLAM
jgi:predicted nucleotidyltransferase component of viral defense system